MCESAGNGVYVGVKSDRRRLEILVAEVWAVKQ